MNQGKSALTNRGFTLIEVLLALLVLGITFIPVSNALLMSAQMNRHFREQIPAVREAQAAVELTLTTLSSEQADAAFDEDCSETVVEQKDPETAGHPAEVTLLWEDAPLVVVSAEPFYTIRYAGKPPWLKKTTTWVPEP